MGSAPGRPAAYRRRLLVNTLAHGVSMVWLTVLTIATLPALLHGLGAEAFGVWVLIQTFSASSGWLSLADLGISGALTRTVAGHASVDRRGAHMEALSSGLALLAGVGALAGVALALAGPHLLPSLFNVPAARRDVAQAAILVFAGQVFIELVQAGVRAGLEGAQRVDLSRVVTVVTRTGQLGATAILATTGHGLQAVAVGSLVATGVGTALGASLLARRSPGRLVRPRGAEVRALLSYGSRVAGLNASGVLHRTMDRLVVGAVVGPPGVALVEIATQVQGGPSAVLTSTTYVAVSASPWVVARDESPKLRELVLRGTKYSALATLPFVVLAMLLARPLVDVWLGSSYAAAAGLIPLAVAYIGLAATVTVAELTLEGTGHAGLVLVPSLLATVANLVLSIVLVRSHGVAGAFVATVVSMVLFVPIVLRRAFRTYGVGVAAFMRQSLVPVVWPLAAEAAVIGAVLALPLGPSLTLVLGAGLGLIAAAGLAWRVSLGVEERHELRSLVRPSGSSGDVERVEEEGRAPEDPVADDVEPG